MKLAGTTISDIARRANVSKSTVSRVLNDKSVVNQQTRETVLSAAASLGYQANMFARGLASGRSMTVGVVTQKIGSPFYDMMMQGVIQGFTGTGYSPLFVDGQWEESTELEVIRALLGRQVDGLLLLGGGLPQQDLNELQEQLPTIVVGKEIPGWQDRCVYIDNFAGAYDATKHLLDFGHRNIAIVRGIIEHQDAVRRYEGYTAALQDAGLRVDPDLVLDGNFTAQSGIVGVNSLLMRGKAFTAVFCANDMVAYGARLALQRQGIRVPDDVSIVGFDDQAESAFVTPPLTTVRQPGVEMGAAAARGLVKVIQGQDCELPVLRPKLILRESVSRITIP
ncbi:LacI family DNA-binding transcriptional regulator [Neorhodopirellula pilleata]|uniref:Catabolite control protein A n=1 Tax=Neorhodopirellula pilleata TaxID=2714738 RepID=A0A5C6API3_9BACT|nr:LacI family DNA-binding transcriptional regulator [Neorhodopirellula pilleata]TWU01895.1 Catabolite control protein A [Neorhodopirellula pilleata]